MKGDKLLKEERRLFRLHQYKILDTETEKAFNDLVQLAAEVCETPLAAISLIDKNRHWFKSRVGFSISETPRDVSFCNLTIQQDRLLEIEDVRQDERFRLSPFVLEAPNIRFYAAMPLISSGGEAIGSLCVMDTRIRRLGDKQRVSLETLARQVINLLELRYQNLALEEAREESQKALKAKAEFLSVMSHELRTPLNGMLGMVHWLMQDSLRPDQHELVSTLKFSAENLLSLVNDILDYNKINAEKLKLEKVDFNLNETLRQLNRSFEFVAKQKGVSFHSCLYEATGSVKGDPLRLIQVLTNLLGNAVKFTSRGEVKLEVSLVMETDNFLTLKFKVKDTGIGIAPEQQELIFEEFSQGGPDISRKFGGTGLGLSITRSLLRLMESEIHLKSELNVGSEFWFTLSFQKSQQEDQERNSSSIRKASEQLATKKILLSEDNEVNRLVAMNYLKKWGIQADVAVDGQEAVNLCRLNQYDLILMDLQMPELDGFEATRLIRKLSAWYNDIPIIALTASAVLEVKQEAFEAGISDFLMKPFHPDSLYFLLCQNIGEEASSSAKNSMRNKIEAVAGEDPRFRKELVRLYRKSFQEIQKELAVGKFNNADNLQRLCHKHQSTFQLLKLEDLLKRLSLLQKLIEAPVKNHRAILKNKAEITTQIEQLIRELEEIG